MTLLLLVGALTLALAALALKWVGFAPFRLAYPMLIGAWLTSWLVPLAVMNWLA